MIILEETINIYEKSRQWYGLPKAPWPEKPKSISGIKEALEGIELVLLDSYGVLCRGSDVIPEAIQAIAYLREKNIPFCIVSNDTMTGFRNVESKYQKLGFDFTKEEAVTSLDVVEKYLEKHPNLSEIAATCDPNHVMAEKFPQIQNLNIDNGKVRTNVDTLLYLVGKGWTEKMQENLIESSSHIQQIVLGNPDVAAPVGDSLVMTPGYYAHNFCEKTGFKKTPLLFGKPGRAIFEQALNHVNYKGKHENVLMVGDSLHTDILGGQNMGFKTLLLKSGILKEEGKAEEYIKKTGIVPTYIANII